ncbi:hypothetical protein [Pseudomonas chlororaphis]|uniref:hypothetical protein n=1 Tax=Pseudomonas chlororaphis TaxID=587753 RepID=UPI001B305561|nr:hypothetical protein [Pseudomonas chlororaphis]MBP5059556.1 hypothetical protein [Pseudomonas chlororaphis]MBP5143434.1 hypothetical protein [Pseudomonas chlororaphis]QTT98264.1 hypothetical protein HUT26_02805 [Pseudomonas chlororaphis]
MQIDRALNATHTLAIACALTAVSALTGCASVSPTEMESKPPVGEMSSGSSAAEMQKFTKDLTPPSATIPKDAQPISEQLSRQPPNKIGIIVIPGQEPS